MQKVYLYCFGINEGQKKLLVNIKNFLLKLLKDTFNEEFDVIIHDLKVFDCEKDSIGVAFGNKTTPYIIEPKLIESTLCVEKIAENKKVVKENLQSFVAGLQNLYNISKFIDKNHLSYVEVNEKATAGIEGAVFNFTLEEVEHLKKIKDLLNGGKIIFVKGDTRLEIH